MRIRSIPVVSSLALSDLESIARVWHEALMSVPGSPALPSADALLQRLTGELCNCRVAVERNGSEIVAFVVCDLDKRWLRQLLVHPRYQGLGIGTRLLASAMQAMPDGWLRTDEANAHARRFYIRRGLRVRRIGPHPSTGVPTFEFEWP